MVISMNVAGGVVVSATAGVLVRRGLAQLLTCSYHLWDSHLEAHPGMLDNTRSDRQEIFALKQESSQALLSGLLVGE